MRPKNVSHVFQCIANGLELYRAHCLFRQRLSLPELSPSPVQEGETGGEGWASDGVGHKPVLKCIRVGYSQNSSKITHMHKKSHLVNITFCFCLYFSFYTTWQFVVLCHISELRFTNIWLMGNIPFPTAPQGLWDTVFATYQLRWKTRVFLENNGG